MNPQKKKEGGGAHLTTTAASDHRTTVDWGWQSSNPYTNNTPVRATPELKSITTQV